MMETVGGRGRNAIGAWQSDGVISALFTVASFVANPKDLLALNERLANTWKSKISS
jgi:hypothetical protein